MQTIASHVLLLQTSEDIEDARMECLSPIGKLAGAVGVLVHPLSFALSSIDRGRGACACAPSHLFPLCKLTGVVHALARPLSFASPWLDRRRGACACAPSHLSALSCERPLT